MKNYTKIICTRLSSKLININMYINVSSDNLIHLIKLIKLYFHTITLNDWGIQFPFPINNET